MRTERRSLLASLALLGRLGPWLRRQKRLLAIVILLVPLTALLQMALPNVIMQAIDKGMIARDSGQLTFFIVLFALVCTCDFIVRSTQRYLATTLVQKMIRDLRDDLVARLLRLPASFHDRQLSGVLVTRATSDFDALNESLAQGVFGAVADLVVVAGSIAGLVLVAGPLALVALVFVPLVGFVVAFFSRALQKAMLLARAKLAELNGFTQECIAASSTVRALSAEDEAQQRFVRASQAYRDAQMKSVVLDAVLYSVVEGIAAVALGCLLWLALGDFVAGITAGIMIASVASLQQIFEPLKELSNRIALLQGAFTSIERVFGLYDTQWPAGGSVRPRPVTGRVECRDLVFGYAVDGESRRDVLSGISFTVPAGTSLAIVGATGSGKSTLARLLTAEYGGYAGSLCLDGQEIGELDGTALRAQLGIVPQDPEIFSGSVRFNITLDRPGIDEEMIDAAVALVGAGRCIARLGGYDALLAENGANLSHGERQLVVFARALVNRPSMLVLDEATSALDRDSEQLVQSATEAVFGGRTVVVIAHRLSTVRKCDRIIVLDHGRIVESGDHRSLLLAHGVYCDMLRSFVDRRKP